MPKVHNQHHGDDGILPADPSFEPVLSAVVAGKLLRLHPVTLLRWARAGRVPHCRLGRKVTFRASELNSWYSGSTLIVPFVSPHPKGEGT